MVVIETTTTTRTTVWRRRRVPLLLWSLPVAGMLLLLFVGLTAVKDDVEAELTDRARAALEQVGADDAVTVTFSGRDASLSGTVASTDERADLRQLVERVDGVRVADVSSVSVGAAPG